MTIFVWGSGWDREVRKDVSKWKFWSWVIKSDFVFCLLNCRYSFYSNLPFAAIFSSCQDSWPLVIYHYQSFLFKVIHEQVSHSYPIFSHAALFVVANLFKTILIAFLVFAVRAISPIWQGRKPRLRQGHEEIELVPNYSGSTFRAFPSISLCFVGFKTSFIQFHLCLYLHKPV